LRSAGGKVMNMTAISLWATTAGRTAPPRPPLAGKRAADVCVVGAGFTGLWTAYELKRSAPELEVVVLEAETVGFGASGRNGGWVIGELAGSRERWARKAGRDAVIAQGRAIQATVDEIGAVVEREGIDCAFHKGGSLNVAQTLLELERQRALIAEDREWGLTEADSVELTATQTRARIAVDGAIGARFTPHCARVQPARLADGLAAAAERAGATIYERSRVTTIAPGRVETAEGAITARYVVRATEAYTSGLPGLRRQLVPLNSAMIATEPLDVATWAQLGWDGAETLLDGRRRYVYLQRSGDGRIAIGGRGVPYRYGSRTDREGPLPARTAHELRRRLVELFPVLAEAGIAAGWHGVLGVPRDWSPAVGLDRPSGLAWAGGYVGEGVAATNLAARTLRDLILGRETELTRLPWVGPLARQWEPEPLRFAGVRSVNALFRRADAREAHTGRDALAGKLAGVISGR
jgi:glycine/D-amino acid oxidase-like deaminating enzyme